MASHRVTEATTTESSNGLAGPKMVPQAGHMGSNDQADLEAIRRLKAAYCRLADAKQWDEVAALFTDDAILRFHNVDGSLGNEVTAAEFAEKIGGRVGAGQPVHHVFSHEITVTSDDTATAVWAMEDLIFHDRRAHPEAPFTTMHGFGHYYESYRRIAGQWRIAGFDLTRLRIEIED